MSQWLDDLSRIIRGSIIDDDHLIDIITGEYRREDARDTWSLIVGGDDAGEVHRQSEFLWLL